MLPKREIPKPTKIKTRVHKMITAAGDYEIVSFDGRLVSIYPVEER